jgi:TetR/AcrR family transcriptional regulator, lmrAB and yxaGH operons repressor
MSKPQHSTHEAILSAAHQLFIEKGYFNTSIANIAQACNLSKASLYHHILNKEALLCDIIKRAHEQLKTDVLTPALSQQKASQATLLQLFELLNNQDSKNSAFLLMRLQIDLKKENNSATQALSAYFNDWESALGKLFSAKQTVDDAHCHTDNMMSLLHGAITFSAMHSDAKNLTHAQALIASFV